MPQDLTDDKSILVQVMAWCRQATSHYLNQCWPRSPTLYGVIRPQWVKCNMHQTWYYNIIPSDLWVLVMYIFSCEHAALRKDQSVSPSVRLYFCLSATAFFIIFLYSYHHDIFRILCHWQKWWPCQRLRSEVKIMVREFKKMLQLGHCRTVTPIRINRWLPDDAQRLKWHRSCTLLFSRSSVKFRCHTGKQIANWILISEFPDDNLSSSSQMVMKWCIKLEGGGGGGGIE